MEMEYYLDPNVLIFPITKPPPNNWDDVEPIFNRAARHWGLIRGLIEDQKKARRNRNSCSSRMTATLIREVVARLSLSLDAVDTKDKFSCVPSVGTAVRAIGDKHLVGKVTGRNPKHQPATKLFVGAPAAIVVAMSREANRRAKESGDTDAETVWLAEDEIRALAAPLCEEDLSHKGDEIVLGEVENFAWGSMAHLLNEHKFDCVKSKDLDERSTLAKLEKLGKRLVCSWPGCNDYATKSLGELSDRVKLDTFRRSVYCKEHYIEAGGGGGKRKKAAGKGKGKGKGNKSSKAGDPVVLDDLGLSPSPVDDLKSAGMGTEMFNPYCSSSASASKTGPATGTGTGKIKASWYRRLLGEALLAAELDRVEATKGVGVSGGLTAPWRKDFAKEATKIYAITANGQYVADKLEEGLKRSGRQIPGTSSSAATATATATATASPILNRASYASCSERDGGGGGGTASRNTGYSPLAPARAHGAAKPGVRLLVDNREKRGATGNSQISELTSFLNSRGVPYEVREWKVGDYGWVVQPDAGKLPAAGEVSYEREFVVPRLLERKRVDDLAESMKDGRLVRQKKAMMRARDEGVVTEMEIHLEGETQDRRYMDEIYRRGLTPEDLEAALDQSEGHGFKVVRHPNFAQFSAYLADATTALQRRFDSGTLDYHNFFTWQNFVRVSKGQIPLTPGGAAAERAAAAAKAARGGKRGRPPAAAAGGPGAGGGGRGRPPLPPGSAAAVGSGLRQRTLDGVFGVAGRSTGAGASSGSGVGAQGVGATRASSAAGVGERTAAASARGGANEVVSIDDDDDNDGDRDDDDDDCSVLEVVGKVGYAHPGTGVGGASGPGAAAASSTSRGVGGDGGGRVGGGGRGKRKAVAEAGSSPFTIAAAGGYSPAPGAAKVRRAASPALSSVSKPATAATAPSKGPTPRGEDAYSPLPTGGTSDAQGGGARSGGVGRPSSRGSKRSRPDNECGGGIVCVGLSADRGAAPSGSGGGGRGAKARSLSFADDDVEEEDEGEGEGEGGETRESGTGGGGNKSASGGVGSVMPSFPRDAAAVSLPTSSCSADAGVVDLSLDSPSPPPPPRSRPGIGVDVSLPTQQQSSQRRHREDSGGGAGGVVLEECSSDDDFAI